MKLPFPCFSLWLGPPVHSQAQHYSTWPSFQSSLIPHVMASKGNQLLFISNDWNGCELIRLTAHQASMVRPTCWTLSSVHVLVGSILLVAFILSLWGTAAKLQRKILSLKTFSGPQKEEKSMDSSSNPTHPKSYPSPAQTASAHEISYLYVSSTPLDIDRQMVPRSDGGPRKFSLEVPLCKRSLKTTWKITLSYHNIQGVLWEFWGMHVRPLFHNRKS